MRLLRHLFQQSIFLSKGDQIGEALFAQLRGILGELFFITIEDIDIDRSVYARNTTIATELPKEKTHIGAIDVIASNPNRIGLT